MLHIRNNPTDKTRNAYFDVYELLKLYSKVRGVSHFFAGILEDAQAFVDFGFYISFAGVITYKPRRNFSRPVDYFEIIKNLPLDMILVDTDSPYVAPVPHRGERNEPIYIKDIVRKIAQIKGLKEEIVALQLISNAKLLFDI
jgi:TatD DNase family protein